MSKHMKMKNTIRFTKIFFKHPKRITFSNPQKSDVLIFDQTGSKMIKRILLYDINCTVLPVRNELNYVSIQIIALTIKNLIKIVFQYKGKRLFHHKELRKITWYTYLLSCVEYISPKVVLTLIDNSGSFQWISRHYNKATFYAIQNGFRGNLGMTEKYFTHSMPHFMCFGRFEEDLYKKYNCKVDNFYPVGSLLGAYYKYEICNGLRVVDYDICLVSQFREQIITGGKFPEFKKSLNILNTFLEKYIDEHDSMMANIACASNRDIEEQYFETVFGNSVHVIKNIRDEFTTYRYMDRSDVILTFCSTAGVEAFGLGKKVLFCNFSGQEYYSIFPLPDVCNVNIPDYNVFCAKLDYLRGLDDLTYRKLTEDSARYFMNYDAQMPPNRFIREKIFECLY